MDVVRILFAVLFPPPGVALQAGPRATFWLDLPLTILGFVPGIVHALSIILRAK